MRVVISQPMYFPWVGHLEQIALADVYVLYDDVQFSPGSFFNRVQIRTQSDTTWLTVPLVGGKQLAPINQISVNNRQGFEEKHLNLLRQNYRHTPFLKDVIQLVGSVFSQHPERLSELSELSTRALARYFSLDKVKFMRSSELHIDGAGSDRVFKICKHLGATEYITGHGARKYLQHEMFEENRIRVSYMDYSLTAYPQIGEKFTPFVSALDLISMRGRDGLSCIQPRTVNWKNAFTLSVGRS